MTVAEYRATAPENPLRSACVEYLRLKGYIAAVTDAALSVCSNCGKVSSQQVDSGWPDITACAPGAGRLVAVETKTVRGRLRPAQTAVLERLKAAGAIVCVPRSLDDLRRVIEARPQDVDGRAGSKQV
jgi:hypothetical protein